MATETTGDGGAPPPSSSDLTAAAAAVLTVSGGSSSSSFLIAISAGSVLTLLAGGGSVRSCGPASSVLAWSLRNFFQCLTATGAAADGVSDLSLLGTTSDSGCCEDVPDDDDADADADETTDSPGEEEVESGGDT